MKKLKKQQGSATIEATISLTCFILVIIAIYSVVNFCIVQAKMAYAINTTAKEISQYSYFYHVFGLKNLDKKLTKQKQQALETFDVVNEAIHSSTAQLDNLKGNPEDYFEDLLKGDVSSQEETFAKIQEAQTKIGDVIDNPSEFIKSMVALAGKKSFDKIKSHIVAAPIAKAMTRRHFGKDLEEGNNYLKGKGVVDGYDGVNFNLSTMFNKEEPENIKIVVVYNLDLTPMLPFDAKVTISQSAVVRGWLGGDLR